MTETISLHWIEAWAGVYEEHNASAKVPDIELDGLAGLPAFNIEQGALVVRWKNQARPLRHESMFRTNPPQEVVDCTREAFSAADELEALWALSRLKSVQARTASAFLMAHDPTGFTVMDIRAWRTLEAFTLIGEALSEKTWTRAWPDYLALCKSIAKTCNVGLRQLDRALWKANGRTDFP